MSKPSGGPGSLFGFLFDAETQVRADEKYQRALAEDQERQAGEGAARESEERREGEPKCWIN
jgi:hypothetical protein